MLDGWSVRERTKVLIFLAASSFVPTLQASQTPAGGGAIAKAAGNGKKHVAAEDGKDQKPTGKPEKTIYDFTLPGPDGKDVPLANYKGKYLLIVNLGRKSTYNEQLPALIKLNSLYKDKGLVVIGVPSNDFGAAEPGTAPEVQKAYTDAKVDFALMTVSKVSGDNELPLFGYLTKGKDVPAGGPVHWNYTKFVIDGKGVVAARLDPDVAPDSPEMLSTLDQVLAGTYKPKKAPKAGPKDDAGGEDDDE